MTIRIFIALAIAGLFAGSAYALPVKPIDTTENIVVVRGGPGHGHGHAHGNRGRHLGWSIGRHRGWAHSRHRMH